jgi:hypothetical protein
MKVGLESFYKMGPVFQHLTLLLYYSKLIVKNSHLQILKTYLLFYFYILNKKYYFFQMVVHLYRSSEVIFKSTV